MINVIKLSNEVILINYYTNNEDKNLTYMTNF